MRSALLAIGGALAYGALLAVAKVVPRYDCIALVVFLVCIFRELDRTNARSRAIGLHGVTVVLLGAFLLHLWTLGYEGRNAVFGGVLPWSDSHDYYGDSLRLVHGERFLEVGSKRPLYSVALAGLLRITNGDLRVCFVVMALVGAWATAIAALEVWKTHGWRSALVVYLLLLFIERRWTGFVQTEHFGLPLGAIAFVLVWRAHHSRSSPAYVLAALFALTLALVARTGSFFVLPALGIWAARRFYAHRLRKLWFLVLAGNVVLGGFALNRTVVATCGSGVMFSDYPGIVYGMMHGEGFGHLGATHPELSELPIQERVKASWAVVKSEAKAKPQLVAYGLAYSGIGLFLDPLGMFGYVWTNPDDHVLEDGAKVRAVGPIKLWVRELGVYSLLNAVAMGVLGAALVISSIGALYVLYWKRRKDPELSLLRWAYGGILLSAPFLPPSITSGQQTQTATMAFVAALPAVVLLARTQREKNEKIFLRGPLVWTPPAIGVGLVAIVSWMKLAPLTPPPCIPSSAPNTVLRVFPGADVEIVAKRSLSPRKNAESDLRSNFPLLGKHNPELVGSVEPYLRPGTRYLSAFDACDRSAKIVVDDERVLPPEANASTWTSVVAVPLATASVVRVRPPNQTPVLP